MSMLVCSARMNKVVSNRVRDSCIFVLFSAIVGVPALFLAAWVYGIFGRPSVSSDAAGPSLSYISYLYLYTSRWSGCSKS
jgi:hypothetical protein